MILFFLIAWPRAGTDWLVRRVGAIDWFRTQSAALTKRFGSRVRIRFPVGQLAVMRVVARACKITERREIVSRMVGVTRSIFAGQNVRRSHTGFRRRVRSAGRISERLSDGRRKANVPRDSKSGRRVFPSVFDRAERNGWRGRRTVP